MTEEENDSEKKQNVIICAIEKLLEVSAGWHLDHIRRCILILDLRRAAGAGKLRRKDVEFRIDEEK
jgi:hypothetical protein